MFGMQNKAPELPEITKNLPPLYNKLAPLTSEHHAKLGLKPGYNYSFAANTNSFPLAVEEFAAAQRHYPILFTVGDKPMPAVLLSVRAGHNPYVTSDGQWKAETYVPAYVRRYPFLLVRAKADQSDFALCFDTSASHVGETDKHGFFASGSATQLTDSIMEFCVSYEKGIDKTRRVCAELAELDLFAEPSIKLSKKGHSVELKGLQVVSEEKLRALPDETLGKLARSGVLAAVYAHLFSLSSLGYLEGMASSLDQLDTSQKAN